MICVMLFLAGGCESSQTIVATPPPPAAPAYLNRLKLGVEMARTQLPAMISSAEEAAQRYAREARIFAAGSQPEFAREMVDRNGGLAEIGYPPAKLDRIQRGDVVLFGVRGEPIDNDRLMISRWREEGAYVVVFASKAKFGPYFQPNALFDNGDSPGIPLMKDGRIIPSDGTINLINAWAWTGEFIAACTRLKKPPPIAGPVRVAYRGSDSPIGAGVLGKKYLDVVDGAIAALKRDALVDGLPLAGKWVADAGKKATRLMVVGKLFDEHFRDRRAPLPFGEVREFKKGKVDLAGVTMVLGGQTPPQLAIDMAHLRRTKVIYSSADRARDDRGAYIIYVNPHCPADDGVVAIDGYNVPALPIGTIMQSAVYWSIVAEAQRAVAAGK
jgi:hypothetical protein